MKAKRIACQAISILVLVITVLAYIMAFYMGIELHRGLLSLLTALVAELEIYAGVRYFVFEQNGNFRKAKTRRTGMICGFVILGSILLQMLACAFHSNGGIPQWREFYFTGGFILFEPLQGGIMILLEIRHFVNAKRERMENMEKTTSVQHSIVCGILNAIASAVLIIASIQYVCLTLELFVTCLFWITK